MAARHRGRSSGPGGNRGGGHPDGSARPGPRQEPRPGLRQSLRQGARRAGTVLLASGLVLTCGSTLAPAAQAAGYRATASPVRATAVRASALGAAPQAAPGLDPSRASGGQYPAVVSLTSISPSAPTDKDTVTITGTVRNGGSHAISSPHVGMWVNSDSLDGRSQIAAVAARTTPSVNDPAELEKPQAALGTLAPGATSAPFTLSVKVHDLGLEDDHVYELAVDAQGSVSGDSPRPLGIARTFLPLSSSGSGAKPTRIATLWPVTEAPRVQPQTYSSAQKSGQAVLTDDTLASELGVDGRLGQLQAIGAGMAALKPTWVIDPDLITSVLDMESPYQVARSDDSKGATPGCDCTAPGTGSAAAKNWLSGMQSDLSGLDSQQIVSLPAADPDLASIAHNAPGSVPLDNALRVATGDLGQVGLNPLQVTASHTVAWPYQGYLDTSIVGLARSLGSTQIIANSSSLPNSQSLTYTPDAARPLGKGMTAVAADSTLSAIFAGDLSTQSEQALAEQRFLAETLTITLEQPANQRSILVAPPRDMSASTAQTLAKSLQDAVNGKWVTPVSYGAVAQAAPSKGAGTTVPSVSHYPRAARKTELSSTALGQVGGIQSQLAELGRILSDPAPISSAFNSAILRSVSTQWRDQPNQGATYRSDATNYLANLHGAVSILPKPGGSITLSGSGSATIPITVQNDLPQGVLNLAVELNSVAPTRLSVGDETPGTKLVTVRTEGNTKLTLRFPVKAYANGQVTMTAQLYTVADQRPYGDPVVFEVDITQLPDGVIAVLAGGVLLVLLAGVRLYWKGKKNAALKRRGPEGGPDGTDPDPGTDAGGPEAAAAGTPAEEEVDEAERAPDEAPSEVTNRRQ